MVQPLVANYRIACYTELAKLVSLTILASPTNDSAGFGKMPLEEIAFRTTATRIYRPFGERIFMYQAGILREIISLRPDAVIIFANLRYLSFWTTLVFCRLFGIAIFAHGHGAFKKKKPSAFWRLVYRALSKLLTKYICYTESVAKSLRDLGFPIKKIVVADNSLHNPCLVRPHQKGNNEPGLLFIGRLRERSGLELLVTTAQQLRSTSLPRLELHIIGGGENLSEYRRRWADIPWIFLYGELFDPKEISLLSLRCFAGCYPGDAGLSIVHLMSLSLPPITHNELSCHGPEVSYISDEVNGVLFSNSGNGRLLAEAIALVAENLDLRARLQQSAFEYYMKLVNPSLAKRVFAILQ
jgi:glycosyltransferase involved in cell wall biosynthesis